MERDEIKAILERYSRGECTAEEGAWVERNFTDYLLKSTAVPRDEDRVRVYRAMRKGVFRHINQRKRSRWLYFGAAAAILLAVGAFWSIQRLQTPGRSVAQLPQEELLDIDPGGNRATLTLADGRKVFLDDVDTGQLVADEGVRLRKTGDGKVIYERVVNGDDRGATNTIETPRGGQYNVVLPDGTTVWLNAASSLSYPTQFAANERRVSLTGEAYFEVEKHDAPDARPVPFYVDTEGQEIMVLGTHFNVNAYAEEPSVKTTLLEGAVRVADKSGRVSRVLQPGEQCVAKDGVFSVQQVNAESAIAWKNNVFFFYHVDLPSVLRQIERWYDVDVDETDIPDVGKLYGEIAKDKKLSAVLEALSVNTGLHFELTGRRVAVTH